MAGAVWIFPFEKIIISLYFKLGGLARQKNTLSENHTEKRMPCYVLDGMYSTHWQKYILERRLYIFKKG